jgi:predicted nucleic acid-binding protein
MRHVEAARALHALEGERAIIPITILTETLCFVRTRYGLDHHRRLWANLESSSIEVLPADLELLEEARRIDERYADVGYGFADCTLLASCEMLRTARVLSFDRRLAAYRPSFASALEVMP